ncbi:poly-beta-1,6-N-acetyl-D-glucosamine synthase [Bacillus cereus]|uniref:Poly-beta-1,6-N-acetyl-D-glucosamine synthase n=1 Tax=Bacillus cereus VD184 TaxID=1053242 RepID=A0A9W5R0Y3_BACCE|nr:poly-beta-1,6-N-acetyl-D-glucosamine synthase [Bacillus cereus]EOQ02072.1 poly-beta-1,6 N-acetyl-D-glucosamine synthase [Bacillus cereus VD184]
MLFLVSEFLLWYPIFMSIVWITGAIIFVIRVESKLDLKLHETPFVSILVPCYNEEKNIQETIKQLLQQNYPNYEIIIINDGSIDRTASVVNSIMDGEPNVRFIDLKENQGKANALRLGLLASNGDYLVCVDADALLEPTALQYMIPHFLTKNNGRRIGAVTGNPRVRNRSSLLSKIQISEYSSVVGLIKRTQHIYGKIMTVSGVVVAFRKQAVLDCGLWDRDIITEDIAITWRLQKHFWDIVYEPKAICWMLVPETIYGLWKQRVRWAQGGLEVMLRHWNIFSDWRQVGLYVIFIEQVLSLLWAILWGIVTILFLFKVSLNLEILHLFTISSCLLSVTCIIQFFIGILVDSKYDSNLKREYLWAIWYPVCYWYINVFVVFAAIWKISTKDREGFAIWESPDRGLQEKK